MKNFVLFSSFSFVHPLKVLITLLPCMPANVAIAHLALHLTSFVKYNKSWQLLLNG